MSDTEVVVASGTQVSLHETTSTGFEEASVDSYAIPFLQILQSNSPQVKKSDGAYVKGAEDGMLYNTVTQELYDGVAGVTVIPCHYTQRFIEWKLRELGGGFVKEHTADSPTVTNVTRDEKGRSITDAGTQLVDTRSHYVMIVGKDGSLSPALVAMASTQLRKSRQWMSLMQGTKIKNAQGMYETAPMYSRKYTLSTRAESNDKGSWFGYNVALSGLVDDPSELQEAKSFHISIRAGKAKTEHKLEEIKEVF